MTSTSCRSTPIVAYHDTAPVGWIAVAPREEFGRLNRSPLLKPVDHAQVWANTCFYIDAAHRRTGIAVRLIAAAVEFAAGHHAEAVEAYPLDIGDTAVDSDVYTGTLGMFTGAGFTEITRRRHRPIVRRRLTR